MASSKHQHVILLSLAIAMLVMAISTAWIGVQVRTYREYQMDLDEAVYANRGLDIASPVKRSSLSDL